MAAEAELKALREWHKKRFGNVGNVYKTCLTDCVEAYRQCKEADKSTEELFGKLPDDVLWD